jgi:NAD kinase
MLSVIENNSTPWTVSPNPTTAAIHISGSTPLWRVQVFSIDGKKQLEQTNTQTISLESLHQGVYLVRLQGTDKQAHTFKVIKQ